MRYEMRRRDVEDLVSFIGAKTRESGDELNFERCPVCGGGEHGDKWTFSLNMRSGACCCLREKCGYKGHFTGLCRDLGHPLDPPREERPIPAPEAGLSAEVIAYFLQRGIGEEVLRRYRISAKKEDPAIAVFPFYDGGGELRFVKYRNTAWRKDGGGSKEWCEKGGQAVLFGMDRCTDRRRLVITEGQIDSLSLCEAGIANAVSVPTGARGSTWIPPCREFVRSFKEIVVFGDCENGEVTLAEMIAGAFPESLVRVVRQADYRGEKDANGILCEYGPETLRLCVEQAEEYRPDAAALQPLLAALAAEKPEKSPEYDDRLMGRLYAKLFRKELRYNTSAKEWFRYNGRNWERDEGGMQAARKAKLLTDALMRYAAGTGSRDFHRFVLKYGDLRRRKTMVEDARSECFISSADFDRDGRYYNCLNCEIDLTTFEPVPHDPEHLLSKCSNVVYDENAVSPQWEKFLSEIFLSRAGLLLYFQKLAGITLTTDTSLQKLWMLYGPTTRNGKSTAVEVLGHMHGNSAGYAMTMAPETLAERKVKDSRQASGDIARLNGCRFLVASEPPKRMLFSGSLVKQLTGGDTVVARHLMEREFEFRPQFKLLINTNYRPSVQDDTLFESERIVVIPFDRHFTPQEQDPGLKDRLCSPENISGIFNWCLAGLRLYRETGLDMTEEIRAATEDYRKNSDKIALFLEEKMEKTGRNSAAGTVYQQYKIWCEENGYGTESKRSFFDELRNKGIYAEEGRVNGMPAHNILKGYELAADHDTLFL